MRFNEIKQLFEYMEGAVDNPPEHCSGPFKRRFTATLVRGLWWGILAALVFLFCGQSSKFIYIDF